MLIRASSLPTLFDCPCRWEATHILNRRMPKSSTAQLGSAIHAGAAIFDISVMNGEGITPEEAEGVLVDVIYDKNIDVDWGENSQSEAEKIGRALHKKYCREISPKREYVAIEITCDRLHITDIDLTLTGTVDRVKKGEHGYGISDIKSGKTAVSKNGTVSISQHVYQIGVYELLAEQASGLKINEPGEIIGINTGKTEVSQRVSASGEITGARELLIGDGDSKGILEIAATILHSGLFYGNPRSMLCNKKFCPIFETCRFRK